MDPALIASILGIVGSIGGALVGAVVGYKLNNRAADIEVYVDNQIVLYYMEKFFAVYIPISIVNEGNKSATISSFELQITSPTGQNWTPVWYCFSENNYHVDGKWKDGKLKSPILVHGNSGVQHYLKFIESNLVSDGWSNVSLQAGKYSFELSYLDRDRKAVGKYNYEFEIGTEASQSLSKLRISSEDYQTWAFSTVAKP